MKTIKVDPLYHLATERSDFITHKEQTIRVGGVEFSVVLPLNIHVVFPKTVVEGFAADFRDRYEKLLEENPHLFGRVEVSFTGLTEDPPNVKNVIQLARLLDELRVPVRTVNVGNSLLTEIYEDKIVAHHLVESGVVHNINCRSDAFSMVEVGRLSQLFQAAGGSARLSVDSHQLQDEKVEALLSDALEHSIESVIVRSTSREDFDLWEDFKLNCVPLYQAEGLEYEVFTTVWRDRVVKFYDDRENNCVPVVWKSWSSNN